MIRLRYFIIATATMAVLTTFSAGAQAQRSAVLGGAPSARPLMVRAGPRARSSRNVHMRKALTMLQQADAELQAAKHNKDGHRGDAARQVEGAIADVKQGIAYSEENPR